MPPKVPGGAPPVDQTPTGSNVDNNNNGANFPNTAPGMGDITDDELDQALSMFGIGLAQDMIAKNEKSMNKVKESLKDNS